MLALGGIALLLAGGAGGGSWEATLLLKPPGPPFVEVDHKVEGWSPPEPTRAERRAGFIPYWRPNPSDFRPWSRPRAEERCHTLKTFAAPGEREPLWVGIYALDNLRGVRAAAGDLRGPGRIPRRNLELRLLRFWPQRTGWRSKAYRIVPELLLPFEPFDLPEGTTAVLWLTVKVPEGARPGRYIGGLKIWAEGRPPLRLRVEVRILPFSLEVPPDKRWLLYGDLLPPWRPTDKMPEEALRADLRDMREHGIDGLIDFVRGAWRFEEGRARSFEVDELSGRIWRLAREVGFRGPFVFSINPLDAASRAIGASPPGPGGRWPGPLLVAVESAYSAAREALSPWGVNWFLYAADEPRGDDLRAAQLYECAKRAGLSTFVTLNSPEFARAADRWLDVRCYAVWLLCRDEDRWRELSEETRRAGDRLWLYGSGSYLGQEGRMNVNRYIAGLLFWKSRAEAEVSWTYQRTFGKDPYDEFSDGKFACLTYPDFERRPDWSTYKGPIPTLQWEGLREGIDDARYVYTLSSLISEAMRRGLSRAASEAREDLERLLEAVPWMGEFSQRPLSNSDLQRMRWALASAAEELALLLKGGRPRRRPGLSPSVAPVRIEVESVREHPLPSPPSLVVGWAKSPPRVDGRLDDPCWKEAARVNLADARTGGRAPVRTTVLVAFDAKCLYVAFDCKEPNVKGMVYKKRPRDGRVWEDDSVELFLDPLNDRRHYYHFIVNAAGSALDERGEAGGRLDPSWNPRWLYAASVREDGWSVEMTIPWVEVGADPFRMPLMAVNFCRTRRAGGEAEFYAWSPTFDGFHVPERFGNIVLPSGPIRLRGFAQPPPLWGKVRTLVGIKNATGHYIRARFVGEVIRGGRVVYRVRESRELSPGEERESKVWVDLRPVGSALLLIRCYNEATGEFLWSIRFPVELPEPLEPLRRGLFAWEGQRSAEFPLRIRVSPATARESRLSISLHWRDERRALATASIEPKPGMVRVVLETRGLPAGRYTLRLNLTAPKVRPEVLEIPLWVLPPV